MRTARIFDLEDTLLKMEKLKAHSIVAVTTGLTRPEFRESDILDTCWILEDPEVPNDGAGRRIGAARNGDEGTQMNRKATQ